MMSNLVSQLEVQNASDRLNDVMEEIPKVRAEVGYPPLVTPLSQIVGTQAVLNVLSGKRWSIIPSEMKDYIAGYYGKAPGPLNKEIVKKVLGDTQPLDPDIAPGSLVTTTYDEVAAEAGDLAKTEEDVLMWALFPNEARTYLSKHRTSEKCDFLLEEEANGTKEEQTVDINQIKELIKVVEESGVGEVTVEEAGSRVTVRAAGQPAYVGIAAQPAAESAAEPAAAPAAAATDADRPGNWIAVISPMVGTFYAAPSPDAPSFVQVGDEVTAGQSLCIVEAMKLMNEIPAEQVSIVREICVENAQPVEYGTVLLYLEPIVS
jgi:oxaloacetate decarboxylase alpha subunit